MSSVWKHSRQTGTARLLLLAIADAANERGEAWPGIKSLSKKCLMTDRNIQKLIKVIELAGELAVVEGGGHPTPNGPTNMYIVITPGIEPSQAMKKARPVNSGTPVSHYSPVNPRTDTGERQGRRPVNSGTPNPSVNRQLTQSGDQVRAHEADVPVRHPAAADLVSKLGLDQEQTSEVLEKIPDLTPADVAAWDAYLPTSDKVNPIGFAVYCLKRGQRRPSPPLRARSNGHANAPPRTPQPDLHEEQDELGNVYLALADGTPWESDL